MDIHLLIWSENHPGSLRFSSPLMIGIIYLKLVLIEEFSFIFSSIKPYSTEKSDKINSQLPISLLFPLTVYSIK